jgi:hypothetical protein
VSLFLSIHVILGISIFLLFLKITDKKIIAMDNIAIKCEFIIYNLNSFIQFYIQEWVNIALVMVLVIVGMMLDSAKYQKVMIEMMIEVLAYLVSRQLTLLFKIF